MRVAAGRSARLSRPRAKSPRRQAESAVAPCVASIALKMLSLWRRVATLSAAQACEAR